MTAIRNDTQEQLMRALGAAVVTMGDGCHLTSSMTCSRRPRG